MTELTKEQIETASVVMRKAATCPDESNESIRVKIIKAIAPHVQYAPTEAGVPLSEDEKAALAQPLNDYRYGKRPELAEKLLYDAIDSLLARRIVRKEEPAKLDVVLGIVRAKLVQQNNWNPTYAKIFCEEVRFRVEAKSKPLEGRVTVEEGGTSAIPIWTVKRDGETVLHMSKDLYTYEDAKIYRLGLIAQLKQEEKEIEK